MLRPWMQILPVFVVRWFALRHCEQTRCDGRIVAAFKDTYFKVEDHE